MKWEYDTLKARSLPNKDNLNELDEKGWEFLQIVPIPDGSYIIYVRRPRVKQ